MKYWNALNLISGFGPKTFSKFISNFDSMEHVWKASRKELAGISLNSYKIDFFLNKKKAINVDLEFEKLKKYNVKLINILDDNYPCLLKKIYNPPPVLYYLGHLPQKNDFCLAVVGSRKHSVYGRQICEKIIPGLLGANIKLISGLALGIDTLVHKISNKHKRRNFAVVASGLDSINPLNNRSLAQDIIKNQGAVISEYPLGVNVRPANFYARNRIISGMSQGLIVIEAKIKSGTRITASHALEQGRDVFSVPGSIFSKYSTGSNELIKQGAKCVLKVNDILDEYELIIRSDLKIKTDKNAAFNLSTEQQKILDLIDFTGRHIEKIAQHSNLNIERLLIILTELELEGLIEKNQDIYYKKIRG
ncbi:MAG: DNA-protecting protein DprA [Candidatus Moranbacteria bacterium]|nr:DNA-protecting protein DprA [Candidatus Moranbacteria bacterium]